MRLHASTLMAVILGCASPSHPRTVALALVHPVDIACTSDSTCVSWSNEEVTCTTVSGFRRVGSTGGLRALDAHESRVCGLDDEGRIYCWNAASGGVGTAYRLPEVREATSVAVGSFIVCWSRDGRVECFEEEEGLASIDTPDGTSWDHVSLGTLHGCGFLEGFGHCWGDSYAIPPLSSSETSVVLADRDLHADRHRSCIIRGDGSLWCAGSVISCSPSDEVSEEAAPSPQRIEGDWHRVFLGRDVACALDTYGRPHCWGLAKHGLLGPHVQADRTCQFGGGGTQPSTQTPIPIDLIRVTQVTIGDRHVCAIDEGHNVFCWGSNEQGQLGIPADSLPHYEPTLAARGARDVGNGGGS